MDSILCSESTIPNERGGSSRKDFGFCGFGITKCLEIGKRLRKRFGKSCSRPPHLRPLSRGGERKENSHATPRRKRPVAAQAFPPSLHAGEWLGVRGSLATVGQRHLVNETNVALHRRILGSVSEDPRHPAVIRHVRRNKGLHDGFDSMRGGCVRKSPAAFHSQRSDNPPATPAS